MVDFAKALGKKEISKKINPLEIYDSLDRQSEIGPLRPAQIKVLNSWYNNRQEEKDIIIKLHTGEGKTVIGLLLLLSRINAKKGKCVYICPNKHLVSQTINEAKKFGIPYCMVEANGDLPDDFLSGSKLLICTVQKLFNGRSIFGIDQRSIDVDTIILDDSHACIEAIISAFSLTLEKTHEFYQKSISLFHDALEAQGAGTFAEIKAGEFDSFLPIPYWSWLDNQSAILEMLCKYKDDNDVKFVWPLIKDSLFNYKAFISGSKIELCPINIPIHKFGSFSNAHQRILMSATTQNDSFFIGGFDFAISSIRNPITNPDAKWSGEKMILLPSLIDEWIDKDAVISNFCKEETRSYGVVGLVPSFRKAKDYEQFGADIANKDTIETSIKRLKEKDFSKPVVIVNRYDGIDLPDDSCRLLLIDSKPFFDSLSDKYEESCRKNSNEISIKIAQKVEQGLGRSVRGERDYSVIFVIGHDLEKFMKNPLTARYFTPQTKKQVEIGFAVAELAQEDQKGSQSHISIIRELISQVVSRDDGWKEYYRTEMDKVENEEADNKFLERMEKANAASRQYYKKNFEKACTIMQELVDSIVDDPSEKAWYTQVMALYEYQMSKTRSSELQRNAFSNNQALLMPSGGVSYKKVEYINENRVKRIREWISKHESFEDMIISVNGTLSDLSFGIESEKFESALKEVGEIIGFISQRPDKEIKKGPDNLWCGVENQYFIFECKSEVEESRKEISKYEAGQMNSHCGWFEEEYGDAKVERFIIIPTKKASYYASFTHNVKAIRKGKLRELKSCIISFIKEFKTFNIREISSDKIQEFITKNKLEIDDLKNRYCEDIISSSI